MKYKDILSCTDWSLFRLQILLRDRFKCANCFNTQIIADKNISFYPLVLFYEDYTSGNFPSSKLNPPELGTWEVSTNNKTTPKFLANVITHLDFIRVTTLEKRKLFLGFSKGDDNKIYEYCLIAISDSLNFEIIGDNEVKFLIDNQSEKVEWLFTFGLNVHHSYYQDGLMPWKYPSSDLTTLCLFCHEKLHKNSRIPCFDKNGLLKDYLTPCTRCSSAGWFPEYRHVENGICFRCNGAKYEEFIQA